VIEDNTRRGSGKELNSPYSGGLNGGSGKALRLEKKVNESLKKRSEKRSGLNSSRDIEFGEAGDTDHDIPLIANADPVQQLRPRCQCLGNFVAITLCRGPR